MARYLSPEWVQAFDAALGALDLSDAIAAAAAGSLAAADGALQRGPAGERGPAEVAGGAGGPAAARCGSCSPWRTGMRTWPSTPTVRGAAATATIALGYADALALALGRLDPADALAAGRVRVRGDLAALVAGQEVLAAAADLLGSALDDLTDPIDDRASSEA